MKPEQNEQSKVATYCELMGYLYTSSIAGVFITVGQAQVLKACGYTKGTPDLWILEPRGKYHGLLIEMKAAKGSTSKEQDAWIGRAIKKGYAVVVMFSGASAIEAIRLYMAAT